MSHIDENKNHEQGKHALPFTINGKLHHSHEQYITGAKIREIGHIPKDDLIFLAVKKPWEDESIKDDTRVDLARPEIEHFFSKEPKIDITLIVNGKPKPWAEKHITFEQVVVLAYGSCDNDPNKVYTVTYDKGPHENPEGSMVRGDKVVVKNKMIFNVTATTKG